MKTFPVGIVDDNGSFNTLVMSEELLITLIEKLRSDGIVPVHTTDSNDNIKTYNVQALTIFGKGCKGNMLFLPED